MKKMEMTWMRREMGSGFSLDSAGLLPLLGRGFFVGGAFLSIARCVVVRVGWLFTFGFFQWVLWLWLFRPC